LQRYFKLPPVHSKRPLFLLIAQRFRLISSRELTVLFDSVTTGRFNTRADKIHRLLTVPTNSLKTQQNKG
jgi:hypothetical protein